MAVHPVSILKTKLKENPRASEKEAHDLVRAACGKDQLNIIFDYWFTNAYRSFRVEVKEHEVAVLRQYRVMRTDARRRATALKEKLEMDIMDHMLSNGKFLRHATFAEVGQEAGWMKDLEKLGKPTEIVGKHLTGRDVMNVRMRNSRRKAG